MYKYNNYNNYKTFKYNNWNNNNYYTQKEYIPKENSTPLYESNNNNNNDIITSQLCVLKKTKRDIQFGIDIDIDKKYLILNYICAHIDIKNIKYGLLKKSSDVQVLKENLFHVGLNFHGYNYYLIIKSFDSDKNIECYIISKLDIINNKKEIILALEKNINFINNIKVFKLKLNDNINYNELIKYNDTIIDGKLIYKKNDTIFLINDILYYKSNKLFTMKLLDKFQLIDNDINIINSFINNNFIIKLIKLYTYQEIENIIYNKIQDSDFKINGLIFLPFRTGKYYLYINDNEFEIIKKTQPTNINNIVLSSQDNLDNQKLVLIKTNIIDVYDVYTLDKSNRFGIASIPNIELSHKLRKFFEKNNELIIECKYDHKFSKWTPLL